MRIILAITAYFAYKIWQLDVKTKFLDGKLIKSFVNLENTRRYATISRTEVSIRSWNLCCDELVKSFGSSGTIKMLVSLQESKWER